jgi:hypothetical protein
MKEPELPWQGGCLCGQLRFEIGAPPLVTMACHCRGCQRLTASAYSLSMAIPADGFRLLAGEPVLGGLHGPHRQYYCPHCLSWTFTRPENLDWFVNVRATLLDDAGWFEPYIEVAAAQALPWAHTPAPHRFDGFPELDAYAQLVEGYARQVGRAPA